MSSATAAAQYAKEQANFDDSAAQSSAAILITNAEFIRVIFGGKSGLEIRPDDSAVWCVSFKEDPGISHDGKWSGQAIAAGANFGTPDANNYFNCAFLKSDSNGQISRTKDCFAGLACVVLDDVGTKVDLNKLVIKPTWKLETSPGNFQLGYALKNPSISIAEVDKLSKALTDQGFTDKGANGLATRYMRLPVGSNTKAEVIRANRGQPFETRLVEWNPGQCYSYDELVEGFGLVSCALKVTQIKGENGIASLLPYEPVNTAELIQGILTGDNFHDGILRLSASLRAKGLNLQGTVGLLQALMNASESPQDDRWQQRYADIPRIVAGADKFKPQHGERKIEITPISEILALPPIQWIIKGLLPEKGIAVLYGEPGSGKTFIALNIATSISLGLEWRGRDVEAGRIVYVAAEGAAGFTNRLKAIASRFGIDLTKAPFGFVTCPVNLLDGLDHANLADACNNLAQGDPIKLIIIDTLNRVMPGGNENASEDMGRVINNAKHLQDATGAAIMIVHHSGKDASKGARGHSSLRAAVDTELEVRREGPYRVLRVAKQRDGRDGEEYVYQLEEVRVGIDVNDLQSITSCVAVPTNIGARMIARTQPRGKWKQAIFNLFNPEGDISGVATVLTSDEIISQIATITKEQRGPRFGEPIKNAIKSLVEDNVLREHEGRYSLVGATSIDNAT